MRRNRLWLRGGCGWLRVVEPIDRGAVSTGDQMAVDVDGDPNRLVAQLVAHVRQALAVLDE